MAHSRLAQDSKLLNLQLPRLSPRRRCVRAKAGELAVRAVEITLQQELGLSVRYNVSGMLVLTINEIFHSIQGESTHAGRPCVFVRLTACDLRCSWCDTPYAFTEGRKMSLDDVIARSTAIGVRWSRSPAVSRCSSATSIR